jgi:hypothetical protein
MNKKNVKRYIDKINLLYDNVLTDDEMSEMEKNLLLSYTKSLYESIIEGDEELYDPIEEVVEVEEELEEDEDELDEEEVYEVEDEEEEDEEEEEDDDDEDEEIEEEEEELDAELSALFEEKEAKEVSERLSRLPIKDIAASMSINERILTKTELFGGDDKLFKSTIAELDTLNSFEEAKSFLIKGVASQHTWAEDSKHKKAVHFIQLVKRRFN